MTGGGSDVKNLRNQLDVYEKYSLKQTHLVNSLDKWKYNDDVNCSNQYCICSEPLIYKPSKSSIEEEETEKQFHDNNNLKLDRTDLKKHCKYKQSCKPSYEIENKKNKKPSLECRLSSKLSRLVENLQDSDFFSYESDSTANTAKIVQKEKSVLTRKNSRKVLDYQLKNLDSGTSCSTSDNIEPMLKYKKHFFSILNTDKNVSYKKEEVYECYSGHSDLKVCSNTSSPRFSGRTVKSLNSRKIKRKTTCHSKNNAVFSSGSCISNTSCDSSGDTKSNSRLNLAIRSPPEDLSSNIKDKPLKEKLQPTPSEDKGIMCNRIFCGNSGDHLHNINLSDLDTSKTQNNNFNNNENKNTLNMTLDDKLIFEKSLVAYHIRDDGIALQKGQLPDDKGDNTKKVIKFEKRFYVVCNKEDSPQRTMWDSIKRTCFYRIFRKITS